MSTRPAASISVDLDNKWAYLRAAGRDDWENCSSYLPMVIERMIDLLGSCELPLTVFLVGRDLRSSDDVNAIERFNTLQSWEPANHSYNHLPWMHTLDTDAIRDEIESTHHAIETSFGRPPRGFRGPGFSCPDEVLSVLTEWNYLYDASIFPTSMAPIARAVFLARTRLRGEQRDRAKKLYGGMASMRKPNRPYLREIRGRSLCEIPVTVMPLIRTPIHFSYLNFIAGFNVTLAKTYFRAALATCRRLDVPPSLLLHPPDFLGCEDDSDMAYLPGMTTTRSRKLDFMKWALSLYASQFDVTTMIKQVQPDCATENAVAPLFGQAFN
ncbi:polysaccharide deacetylase family protein [Neorhodopirellula pilleata]|uniref:Polysaccharide deacetylase n=1 Tax=Neorhodopirellula pilleata TaxID=2714738 RepID=A0A5C6A016_9BACT|nr:polysaccharide deacetylase family protein [Neorhodopirellula pilleata]TWT92538.1 Polysaccharide deacetylase [Neorhodopirellula pilleata]